MEKLLGRLLNRIAPRAATALTTLIHSTEDEEGLSYKEEVRELRKEVDELRKDNLRIAELYDLVFERLKQDKL